MILMIHITHITHITHIAHLTPFFLLRLQVSAPTFVDFLRGAVSTGAFGIVDHFHLLEAQVLSVAAQQLASVQRALQARVRAFHFEGAYTVLDPYFSLALTAAPTGDFTSGEDHAATKLPVNLRILLRPVAMYTPSVEFVSCWLLFSAGFLTASQLARKIEWFNRLARTLLPSEYQVTQL